MGRPGFLFLVCPDPELLRRRVDEILLAEGMAAAERKTFWGDDEDPLPAAFWEALTLRSLFATPKAIVLRRAGALKAEAWDKLDKALHALPPEVALFLCLENPWDKKTSVPAAVAKRPAFAAAKAADKVWQSPGLTEKTVRPFIQEFARKRGLTITPRAADALARVLPLDAAAARLELEKIGLAAAESGEISAGHAALVNAQREWDLFAFMDALSKGGSPIRLWEGVIGEDADPDAMLFPMIGSVMREARMLWMLAGGEEDKVKVHPYVKQIKTPLARKLGKSGAARLIDLALAAELSVKNGERRADQALETLVSGLAGIFGRIRPADTP